MSPSLHIRLPHRCALYTGSDSPTGLALRLEGVERVSYRALLLLGAEKALVWPIEEDRKRYKQAKAPKNLVALFLMPYEIMRVEDLKNHQNTKQEDPMADIDDLKATFEQIVAVIVGEEAGRGRAVSIISGNAA